MANYEQSHSRTNNPVLLQVFEAGTPGDTATLTIPHGFGVTPSIVALFLREGGFTPTALHETQPADATNIYVTVDKNAVCDALVWI